MNISKLIHVTSLFILIFLISFQVFAQSTYYVSPTGNDANDGSSAHPWLTIQGAINNSSVVNGDIIIVKDGTYNESINVTKGITIQSENGYLSTTVISTGTNQSVFLINGVNNVTIKGFTAYGATSSWNNAGVKLVNANNCTITNNRCGYDASHQNWKGIQLWEADNNTISNNICNFNSEIGIQLYGNNSTGSDNNLILNNQVSYNNGASSSFGIQIDGGNTTVNNIRGNVVENNGSYGVYIKNGLLNLGNNDVNDKGNNTIINNNSGAVQLYNAMSSAVNCYYNYWGNIDSTTIDSHIYDNEEGKGEVYFSPWSKTHYVATTGDDTNGNGTSTNPWLTIQGAINNSSVVNGDTIIVKDGTYHENVDVTKEITIKSENGYLSTTVVAVNTSEDYVFEVVADNVTIEGFTTYGATAVWNSSGIGLLGANYCTITNNRCGLDATHQNWEAITLRNNSDNNTISNNIMSFNKCYGINIREGSNNNLIINNQINNNGGGGNGGYGIQNCENSVSNTVRGNTIENNETLGVRIITPGINLGNNDVNDKGNNTIKNNGSYDINNGTSNTINAYYNTWGTNDAATIDSHIYDNDENSSSGEVFFDPWIDDPLPVELTTFTASVIGSAVKLNWQTATEVNNYGFSVERLAKSFDTNRNEVSNSEVKKSNTKVWKTINFIEGHGNSNSPKFYEYIDKTVNSGKYLYRLKQIDIDGVFEYSKSVEVDLGIPAKFKLSQNYPNPFNPTTTIEYSVPQITHPLIPSREGKERSDRGVSITLKIYDILGNEIATLVNEEKQPGVYEVTFDASKYASGIYYYRISVGNFVQTKKMILMK